MTVKIQITRCGLPAYIPLPSYATSGAAGMDLRSNTNTILLPGYRAIIPTGISIALQNGYEAQIRPRSGLAARNGITVLNSPATVDEDFRGEIQVILINHGLEDFSIRSGDRIAQLVVCPVTKWEWEEVGYLDETERGSRGFGSSGIR